MYQIEEKSKNKLLVKGSIIEIVESLADYSASEYKLNYIFKKGTEDVNEFETIPSGTDHLLTISAEDSAQLKTGYNICQIQAISKVDEEEIIPIANLVIEFQPDPRTENDARSFELKIVEKTETAILALADKTMSSISIEGRSYTYNDLDILERRRRYYLDLAGVPSTKQQRKRILVRFTND